jgi:hypothetical protein
LSHIIIKPNVNLFVEVWIYGQQDAERVFDVFAEQCIHAGPSSCVIANETSTVTSIREWIYQVIDETYLHYEVKKGVDGIKPSRVRGVSIQFLFDYS